MKFMKLLAGIALLSAGLPNVATAAHAASPVDPLTKRARTACTRTDLPVIKQVGNFKIHAVWFAKGNVENPSMPNNSPDRLFICLSGASASLSQLDANMDIFTDG